MPNNNYQTFYYFIGSELITHSQNYVIYLFADYSNAFSELSCTQSQLTYNKMDSIENKQALLRKEILEEGIDAEQFV